MISLCDTLFYRETEPVSIIRCVSAVVPNSTKVADEEKKFRDCADLYQAGFHKNAIYAIQINAQETKKVRSQRSTGEYICLFITSMGSCFVVVLQDFFCFL